MPSWLTFRRFVPNWLAFAVAVPLTAFMAMIASWILTLADPPEEDFPPMLALATSVMIFLVALVVGLAAAPLRRLFIGPRFPFVRRGYLVAALVPLLWFVAPVGEMPERAVLFVASEIMMAVTGLVFVWIGGLFGAFDEDERAR